MRSGSGEPLRRFRWWQMFSRSLRSTTIAGPDGTASTYTIDVRHGGDARDGAVRARLFVDGALRSYSTMPAVFTVPDGRIEVAINGFGLKRCHHVSQDGTERQLAPDPASAEGRRARLHRDHPTVSRSIGLVSIALVAGGLGVAVPQLVETISQIPPVADAVGTFTSPVRLPLHLNVLVGLGAVMGSTERALRMRSSWIDELAS
ncbi:hypothetical protein DEJ13_17455 [Curtobacterium sp. MCLR17_007]|uniref:hypothetical protein n=1 Tax=Curtobacterium sp. MCLR17_007 TaxID=2175648 RepID=UPI0021ABE5D1|nr:hypothetical protein [Curtobacterium sp. MCLR17_007]WIB60202.1 hypothetical protein DEJ13_17455 [Curtobacterium sp. MCLR17_007]